MGYWFDDHLGYWFDDHLGVACTLICGLIVAAVIGIVVFVARPIAHRYGEVNCRQWSEATHRETRFVDYSYWAWECVTPNPSQPGEWIPTGQLRGID